MEAAKRKFFQSNDPYALYHRQRARLTSEKKCSAPARGSFTSVPSSSSRSRGLSPSSSSSSCNIIYATAFSPEASINSSNDDAGDRKRFLVACSSSGHIAVWDLESRYNHDGLDESTKNGNEHLPMKPILSVPTTTESSKNTILYDLQFIQSNNGDNLLVASGDPGVLVFKWSDFLEAIENNTGTIRSNCVSSDDGTESKKQQHSSSAGNKNFVQKPSSVPTAVILPITKFQPYPSPATSFGEAVEINSTSYSRSDGILYGGAGDVFGCYQWDLATERLLGTFGGVRPSFGGGMTSGGSGHRDYLHMVQVVEGCAGIGDKYVITGGEDGNMGIWDGKSRKLVEMMNIQNTMDKNKDLVTNDSPNKSFISNSWASWNSGMNSWVSSMSINNGNWLAVCGGAESCSNNITGRSTPSSAGYMTLWHLPSRTFTSGCVTRESLNTVVYNPSMDCFVTGGDEGRVSFWSSTSAAREGRAWSTPAAAYSLSAHADTGMMIVGGAGDLLDCFVDRVKASQLHFSAI